MIAIHVYRDDWFDGVDLLWREAFPDDPPRNTAVLAIPVKLAVQPELFLVAIEAAGDGERVVGSVLAGHDGHRGWLHKVAVARSHRRRGIATRLVRAAEDRLRAIGCPKINLQVREGNATVTHFYRALGYGEEAMISMGRLL